MCLASDVAMTMVNRSIEMAKTRSNNQYYLDSVKLHKLLFLGQYYMLKHYGRPLFEEEITAHYCGPYVNGIQVIPGTKGFAQIKDPFSEREFVYPSVIRMNIIDRILEKYGQCSAEAIIEIAKETKPYKAVESLITQTYKPVIPLNEMINGDDALLAG